MSSNWGSYRIYSFFESFLKNVHRRRQYKDVIDNEELKEKFDGLRDHLLKALENYKPNILSDDSDDDSD